VVLKGFWEKAHSVGYEAQQFFTSGTSQSLTRLSTHIAKIAKGAYSLRHVCMSVRPSD